MRRCAVWHSCNDIVNQRNRSRLESDGCAIFRVPAMLSLGCTVDKGFLGPTEGMESEPESMCFHFLTLPAGLEVVSTQRPWEDYAASSKAVTQQTGQEDATLVLASTHDICSTSFQPVLRSRMMSWSSPSSPGAGAISAVSVAPLSRSVPCQTSVA